MGLFSDLTSEGLEETQDRLGGFQVLEQDIYTGKIKAAYVTNSTAEGSKAMGIVLMMDLDGGKEYRETFWLTNKAGENFFRNKQDNNKKIPLPGYTIIDDICQCTIGKPLNETDAEDKVLNIYDSEQKKEMPKSVKVMTELTGQEVSLAINKEIVNKQVKGDDGKYHDTDETREQNAVDKVFHTASHYTTVEARLQAPKPEFWDSWLAKNKGGVRDRTKKNGNSQGGTKGAPPKPGQGGPKTSSLFGAKS